MDGINNWAVTVCTCAVIVTIVEMLISDTALEKTIRITLGAFMLCAVIIPLGGVAAELKDSFQYEDEHIYESVIPENISDSRLSYVNGQIEELIRTKLADNDVAPVKIQVSTDIDEDNSISMITAEITLSHNDAGRASAVSRLIKNELGISCKTIITQ